MHTHPEDAQKRTAMSMDPRAAQLNEATRPLRGTAPMPCMSAPCRGCTVQDPGSHLGLAWRGP
eukprot:11961093-Alexandrium_andersonii.AAC.1